MTEYNDRRVRPGVTPHSYTRARHPGRGTHIAGVMVHSTRSGRSAGDDGPGTENWLGHPSNTPVVSSSWDALIFEMGTRVRYGDWDNSYSTWCAGFGDAGTWNAGFYYIQLEFGQGRVEDPYTDEEIDSGAQLVAELSKRYDFPIVRLPFLTQVGTPPRGITAHDACANGSKLGKSDPGFMFPWDRFLALANQYAEDDDMGMTPTEKAEFDLYKKAVDNLNKIVAANGVDTDGDGVADLFGADAMALAINSGWSAFLGIGQAKQRIANHEVNHPGNGGSLPPGTKFKSESEVI